MSWRKVPDDKGGGYEVRWRQGTRHRSRTFRSREDAKLFDAEVQRRARLGTLADFDAGIELLADFGMKWWRRSVQERLAVSTRRRYAEVWDAHVLPRLGDYELRQLRAGVIEDELVSAMLADGIGLATVRKALYMLRSCLGYAVRRDLLLYNPAREVDLPKGRRRGVKPLPPEVVERMRHRVSLRDATLLSVMYGAGLRPGEALALRDDSIRERTLLIESSINFGAEKDTKTRKARSVRLLAPIAQDLAAYRLATAKERLGSRYLFPRADGEPWRDHDFRNWRRRVFKPAARDALQLGEKDATPRPYDLRHTFVSLLIAEGRTIAYVAAQAGHSAEECARTYLHLFDEHQDVDPTDRVSAEDAIRAARVRTEYGNDAGASGT
jgi:integrase